MTNEREGPKGNSNVKHCDKILPDRYEDYKRSYVKSSFTDRVVLVSGHFLWEEL